MLVIGQTIVEGMSTAPKGPESLFRNLSGRPGGIGREDVARHQRARLEGAMLEAVGRHGFAHETIGELVGLAGVSRSTFYELFD